MCRELARKLRFLENVSRHKALFLLLLRSDGFITSEDLADRLSVTSRTIKSDIKSISECLDSSLGGVCIEAKRSQGIRIVFQDEELKNEIKEYFKIYQINNISTDFEKRVNYIVRRLLTAASYVKVETFQEELYLNTSNYIQQEMQAVRTFLGNYNLSLRLVPKYGLAVRGDGFNRYVCLVKAYHYFQDSEALEAGISEFSDLFVPRFGNKEQIRQVICSCLTETRIVFSDISLEKFVLFFILLCNENVTENDRSRSMESMDFDYRVTDEYRLAVSIDQAMEKRFLEYRGGNPVLLEFLTYMAVMNTDLYRFKDCTEENYGGLIPLSEEIRSLILSEFQYVFKVQMTSETVWKDLLKVIIPISMKIRLGISDDLDLLFYNQQNNKPVIAYFVDTMASVLAEFYHYKLSVREKNLILNVLYEFINGIELSHKKMKIALLAIDGRLSTQQLKFCMRKGYASFIRQIDTKVLYELERQEVLDYDFYFCPAYGKNMNIPYKPIYFFEEGMTEEDYDRKLDLIFTSAYDYIRVLPAIRYSRIQDAYKIQAFPVEQHLHPGAVYMDVLIGRSHTIALYVCFDAREETIDIFYFENNGMDTNGITQYVFINLDIQGNEQKFKMVLNFISSLVDRPQRLSQYCRENETSISKFFQKY